MFNGSVKRQPNSVEDGIMKVLEKSHLSLTIDEIARKVGATRQTTSKYLMCLEARGKVDRRNVGSAKLFRAKAGRMKGAG